MTIYALVRHSQRLSFQGENEEFDDNVFKNLTIGKELDSGSQHQCQSRAISTHIQSFGIRAASDG
jgi:hypothetical protein